MARDKSQRKLYRPSWAAWFALILHIVWVVLAAYILFAVLSRCLVSQNGESNSIAYCFQGEKAADAIIVAAQLGRLDLVSISLAMLGVALVLIAFGSFFIIRNAAMHAAGEEARGRVKELLPELVTPNLLATTLRENPQLLLSAITSARDISSEIEAEDADKIARTFDED